jgi:hypothetical protein
LRRLSYVKPANNDCKAVWDCLVTNTTLTQGLTDIRAGDESGVTRVDEFVNRRIPTDTGWRNGRRVRVAAERIYLPTYRLPTWALTQPHWIASCFAVTR